jgi:predicted SPOUT superfamily RNA methylase MTH1
MKLDLLNIPLKRVEPKIKDIILAKKDDEQYVGFVVRIVQFENFTKGYTLSVRDAKSYFQPEQGFDYPSECFVDEKFLITILKEYKLGNDSE